MAWPLDVPVLTDGVVTLRAHVPSDLDAMLEMAADPQMVRYTAVPSPADRDDMENFALTTIPAGWDTGTNRGWAVEVDGRYAGNIDLRREPIADIGYALHPSARGRGVMARAVRLAIDWGFTEGGVEIVHWRAHVGNEASLRVAHATGFTLHGTIPGLLYERGRLIDAWTASMQFGDPPLPRTDWVGSTTLESERLRLRPHADRDLLRAVEACNDPASQRWLTALPTPYTLQAAAAYRDDCVWQAAAGTKATWVIADRETDALLGNISAMGLAGVDPTGAEIGYWMHPDGRGRGLMTEALGLVVEHAFDPVGLDRRRLTVMAAAGNAASNAVARACGFTFFGTQRRAELLGDGSYDDLNGYELLR